MHLDNIDAEKWFGLRHGFTVWTDTRYLGGFIRDNESKRDWLKVRTNWWEWNITKIRETEGKHPQESNAVVLCTIQTE